MSRKIVHQPRCSHFGVMLCSSMMAVSKSPPHQHFFRAAVGLLNKFQDNIWSSITHKPHKRLHKDRALLRSMSLATLSLLSMVTRQLPRTITRVLVQQTSQWVQSAGGSRSRTLVRIRSHLAQQRQLCQAATPLISRSSVNLPGRFRRLVVSDTIQYLVPARLPWSRVHHQSFCVLR